MTDNYFAGKPVWDLLRYTHRCTLSVMGRFLLVAGVAALAACTPVDSATHSMPQQWGSSSYDEMGGDGYHEMGGLDGKNWGTWVSAGAVKDRCVWSVRSISSSRPALILEAGSAGRGERVTVDINPDGSTGMSGMIGDHRLVFQTSGCATWERT